MAEREVRIGYFFVKCGEGSDSFPNTLERISALAVADREKTLGGGLKFRLEQMEKDGDLILGEFTRRQMENIPAEASEDGLSELQMEDGSGLAHSSAFLFDKSTDILALQVSRMGANAHRIAEYIRQMEKGASFDFRPEVSDSAWDRFRSGDTRRLRLRIGQASNLASLESEDDTGLLRTLSAQQSALNAPQITVEVSVGRDRQRFLEGSMVDRLVQVLLNANKRGRLDVQDLTATTKPHGGGRTDQIDFLEEFLIDKDSLELSRNPKQSYVARRGFVQSSYLLRRERWADG